MAKIAGLIQARMGSTRLPGKAMLDLAGKPMVGHIIDRLEAVPGLCGIVLATTIDPRNDALVDYARSRGLSVYRAQGEDDIAERLHGAAKLMRADAILKVNGDCPLVDPKILARLVAAFEAAGNADYASNKIEWTYPMGLSAEVITSRALDWCDANLRDPQDRELVANWIKEHPAQFKQVSVTCELDISQFNWTVDTPEDFSFAERVFSALYPVNPVFGLDEVLAFLSEGSGRAGAPAILDIARMDVSRDGLKDFVWPVAREEIFAVRDTFLADAVPFLHHEAKTSRQGALAALLGQLLGEVLSIYRAQAAVRRLSAGGVAVAYPPRSRLYPALAAGGVPKFSGTVAMLERGVAPPAAWRRYARYLRPQMAPNVFAAPPARPHLETSIISIALGHMIQQHAAAIGEPVYYRRFEEWFAPLGAHETAGYGGAPSPALLDALMDMVKRAFAAGNEPLLDSSAKYLRDWTFQAAKNADRYLARLLSAPENVPKRLWRGTGGHLYSRLLSHACRELGGHVTGHDHAHGQGAWRSHSDTVVEIPGCDRFMLWTETQCRMALRNLRTDFLIDERPPQFAVVPGVFRSAIIESADAQKKHAARPRSVMYVGTLYDDDFVSYTPLDPTTVLVDFEARLIGQLRDWGFDVLFKPHPESPSPPPAAYAERLGARMMAGRFEACYQEADIILFGQPNCTPFFNVLATSKPIVVADTGLHKWHVDALDLLKRRCSVVAGRRSVDNRIEMDWAALRAGIGSAMGLSDESFYATYVRDGTGAPGKH